MNSAVVYFVGMKIKKLWLSAWAELYALRETEMGTGPYNGGLSINSALKEKL